MKKFVSQSQWEAEKKALIGNDPLVKAVELAQLDLSGLSSNIPTIRIKGTDADLRVNTEFINKLASYLKITNRLQRMFDKREDKAGKISLVKAIQHYAAAADTKGRLPKIMLLGNRGTKVISDVTRCENYGRVTNATLFELAESLLAQYKSMQVESIVKTSTSLAINLTNNNNIAFKHNMFKDDEVFNFGITLKSTFTTTELFDYNRRLICTNGMITTNVYDKTIIKSISRDSMEKIYNKIHNKSTTGFVPKSFETDLIRAANTRASLAEVMQLRNMAIVNVVKDEHLAQNYQEAITDNYFQGIRMTLDRLRKTEIVAHENEFKYIKTPMSVWDAVNSLTYLASNNIGVTMKPSFELTGRMTAGKILTAPTHHLEGVDRVSQLLSI